MDRLLQRRREERSTRMAIEPTMMGWRMPARSKKSKSWIGLGQETMVVPLAELVEVDILRQGERRNNDRRCLNQLHLPILSSS